MWDWIGDFFANIWNFAWEVTAGLWGFVWWAFLAAIEWSTGYSGDIWGLIDIIPAAILDSFGLPPITFTWLVTNNYSLATFAVLKVANMWLPIHEGIICAVIIFAAWIAFSIARLIVWIYNIFWGNN